MLVEVFYLTVNEVPGNRLHVLAPCLPILFQEKYRLILTP